MEFCTGCEKKGSAAADAEGVGRGNEKTPRRREKTSRGHPSQRSSTLSRTDDTRMFLLLESRQEDHP